LTVATKKDPHLFVVFGATGDLMSRKLLPALSELRSEDKFDDDLVVLAVSRRDWDDERYRRWALGVMDEVGMHSEEWEEWCNRSLYFESADHAGGHYHGLAKRIEKIEKEHGLPGNRVYYLAIPPGAFAPTIQTLGEAKLHKSPGWTRLVVEKPFGQDLESAEKLNEVALRYFDESQIYRIDHYLAKETVQNLAIFRFANMMFESLWNRNHIANVQVTVAEELGVEHRAGYYDKAGALRDMMQNHLTQLLTLIAMDAPSRFNADAVRDEKLRVLRSIAPISVDNAVFGQYGAGEIEGTHAPAYGDEDGVASGSVTETYVAVRLFINNWRWQGVPFYLRTGKRLPHQVTEIVIVFREPPIRLFEPLGDCAVEPDALRIRLQPNEGFKLSFDIKVPGDPLRVEPQSLEFSYAEAFDDIPDAYQTLILDIIEGDQTHFVRGDEVEAAWKLYSPLLENRPGLCSYAGGTWGPMEADRLLEMDGKMWQTPWFSKE
jgi:glucose-6-phosphate 1-dehydrogenase